MLKIDFLLNSAENSCQSESHIKISAHFNNLTLLIMTQNILKCGGISYL